MDRYIHIITKDEVILEEIYKGQCFYKKMTPVFLVDTNLRKDLKNPLYDFVEPQRIFKEFYKKIK